MLDLGNVAAIGDECVAGDAQTIRHLPNRPEAGSASNLDVVKHGRTRGFQRPTATPPSSLR